MLAFQNGAIYPLHMVTAHILAFLFVAPIVLAFVALAAIALLAALPALPAVPVTAWDDAIELSSTDPDVELIDIVTPAPALPAAIVSLPAFVGVVLRALSLPALRLPTLPALAARGLVVAALVPVLVLALALPACIVRALPALVPALPALVPVARGPPIVVACALSTAPPVTPGGAVLCASSPALPLPCAALWLAF